MNVHKILTQIQKQELTIQEGETLLKQLPYEDLGFAKLDHHRELRSGFGEVVFCQGKSNEQIAEIYKCFAARGTDILGTRASQEQYIYVKEKIPKVEYDPCGKTLILQKETPHLIGNIAICTGGTSDMKVAEEAAKTVEFFGSKVTRIYDVGVAGIHRLLSKLEEIRSANCVIAIAGMEGALGSVVAGLVEKPVIAVPTSVGYGSSFGGLSALLTMLNSCAEGMAVVNIDNGFGAGYLAVQINRLAAQGGKEK
ncbi:nickel pincer cofactor biosynthesis protein LarB [Blautia sp.]|uniref:nickel pincer cofactor biosynthesis protein LarB n=1 Tax=Blautia sp. TaxID=1955243 RepID=UPI002E78C8C8|nr:nickel pincer cofactor biosynthesis protein LarB [Blautia sp.]MEE0810384.1 nickel pincer cofactor biosynthesis protein LarB [Blautia sp.]